jgi:anthranilate phosphoribosyltransferase
MSALDALGGWPGVIGRISSGEVLEPDDAGSVMRALLAGEATPAQVAAVLIGMRTRGETADEIAGMLRAVLEASTRVELPAGLAGRAIDIVGTGGDRSHSVNVSTMASLVVAGAGVPVCKHGNRAASSKCGTADVLEALGAAIESTPQSVADSVARTGFGFCFAPAFHPAFRHVGPIRRELGVPTVFNVLGPLANPAPVAFMLLGVRSPELAPLMGRALVERGVKRAWIVHGHGGLDELGLGGPNEVVEVYAGATRAFRVDGADLGFARADVEALRGGDPMTNAAAVLDVLDGSTGPVRDVVLLNAAAALVVAGAAGDLAEGRDAAVRSIDSGAARDVLAELVSAGSATGG